jgi:hypothetical protein
MERDCINRICAKSGAQGLDHGHTPMLATRASDGNRDKTLSFTQISLTNYLNEGFVVVEKIRGPRSFQHIPRNRIILPIERT